MDPKAKKYFLVFSLYIIIGAVLDGLFYTDSYDGGMGFIVSLFATPVAIYIWNTHLKNKK